MGMSLATRNGWVVGMRVWPWLVVSFALSACAVGSGAPSLELEDRGPGHHGRGLADGKLDEAGHPIGAHVFEVEDACVGAVVEGRLELDGLTDDANRPACEGEISLLGKGHYAINVRAGIESSECGPGDGDCGVLELVVRAELGGVLATRTFRRGDFRMPGALENLSVSFWIDHPSAVRFELRAAGTPVAIDYIEAFRRSGQVVIDPPSGVLDPATDLRIEIVDPPEDAELSITCNGEDRSEALRAAVAAGIAVEERTDFRVIVTAPVAALLGDCVAPRRVVVAVSTGAHYGEVARSEVSWLDEPPPCAYEGDGPTSVLVTAFVPFPTGTSVNTSLEAIRALDLSRVPRARVMRLELPVEHVTAPAIVLEAIERCAPDVVVSFGHGHEVVDLERSAYNLRDGSDVPGGGPDNRGRIYIGETIVEGGPDQRESPLPLEEILADLTAQSVGSAIVEDVRDYFVCNEVYYALLAEAERSGRVSGFVHLPDLDSVDEGQRAELARAAEIVLRHYVDWARDERP
jgi:pyrrolidone-carboxylate peptidase